MGDKIESALGALDARGDAMKPLSAEEIAELKSLERADLASKEASDFLLSAPGQRLISRLLGDGMLPRLLDEVERSRALLKRIEWVPARREGVFRCPVCGGLGPREDEDVQELDDGSWRAASEFISGDAETQRREEDGVELDRGHEPDCELAALIDSLPR